VAVWYFQEVLLDLRGEGNRKSSYRYISYPNLKLLWFIPPNTIPYQVQWNKGG